jgi:type VI secretion system secreted protein VgrG
VPLVGQSGRFFQYLITARPWFWFLSQTQDCKVFQNQTVLEIIETVLGDHAIASIDVRTTTAFTPWVYCVQYRESDFNFLSRLMEQEGIYYFFEHSAGKHTLVLADAASASEACPGCSPLKVPGLQTRSTAAKPPGWAKRPAGTWPARSGCSRVRR